MNNKRCAVAYGCKNQAVGLISFYMPTGRYWHKHNNEIDIPCCLEHKLIREETYPKDNKYYWQTHWKPFTQIQVTKKIDMGI